MPDAGDRYPGNPLDDTFQFAEKLRDLERRISQLEGKPLAGTFVSDDSDGNRLVTVGALPDGSRGLVVHSADHAWDLVVLTSEGWLKPHLMASSIDPNASISVTSGSFVPVWSGNFGEAMGPGVEGFFTWATASGTTGEVKVVDNNGGSTSTQALPAASSGAFFIRWLHTLNVGSGPLGVTLQARRTLGTGNVALSPLLVWIQDPADCTSGGVWDSV